MKIAVFLGNKFGNSIKIQEESRHLGKWIASNNHTLIYGGAKTGLMYLLASSAKENGGTVIGVETKEFDKAGYSMPGLDEFYVFDTLAERKSYMMNRADAFIAMPGGTGTLDEISEIICLDKISKTHRPIIFFNIDNFYCDIEKCFTRMIENGFLLPQERKLIHFCDSINEIEEVINQN